MSRLGNERLIDTLDPSFKPFAAALVQLAHYLDPGSRIESARRSTAEQERLFVKASHGKSKYPAAHPGASLHERGLAIDLGGLNSTQLRFLGKVWESWGGRWGGRFRQRDPIHFDPGLS